MIKIIDKGVGTKRVLTLFLIAGTWIIKQFVDDPMILGVCMVMLATPVGSMTAMLAQQYDGCTARSQKLIKKGVVAK